jgi:fucose 4-O-acetylase-like acetyltransferase
MKYRLDWLDAAKGLGILLVTLGHTDIPSQLKTYIYTFHMPLFFFLSGYLFTLKKFPNLKVFLSKRTKSLVLPYLCFSLVAYI